MSVLSILPMLFYLVFTIALLALTVVAIRFLLAATRLLHRKADAVEVEIGRSGQSGPG